jgi:hypothetical protein
VRIEALVVDIFGNQSGTGNDVVRILASERDHAEGIGALLHEIARPGISVAVITPLTIHERDLLETAATQRWDLAILMLNNIMYTKGRLPLEKMIANAGELVRTMHRLFNKPIICFSGIDGSMRRAVMEAGSVCFVPMPPSPDVLKELKQTFKRHLAIWC